MQVQVKGLRRLIKKADPEILVEPLGELFQDVALVVEGKGKEYAPVKEGTLRRSLTHRIDDSQPPLWAKIGTDITSRGAPYGKILDEGDQFHYRGSRSVKGVTGQQTKGWLTGDKGAFGKSLEAIRQLLCKAEKAVREAWDK